MSPAAPAASAGRGPEREAAENAPAAPTVPRHLRGWPHAVEAAYLDAFRQHQGLADADLRVSARTLRNHLRVADLSTPTGARALGVVAAAMRLTMGWTPYAQQALAAWLMLQGRLAEMATGEGKTLAAGLAAATAGLAGLSVHVLTANDYLVQRDRQTLSPFYELLGLSTATVIGDSDPAARLRAYRQSIVYVTGRELAFDHLKDHLQFQGERDPRVLRARSLALPERAVAEPLLPRLQQALIDEADSILLDEAVIPFILSMPSPAPPVAALEAARTLARLLKPGEYRLYPGARHAELSPAGRERVQAAVPATSPLWPPRQAFEMVRAALVAEQLLHRGRDYAVGEEGVQLIDEITGRIASGRQWNHPLHAMVELKEGLPPSPAMRAAASITFQRFFPRYDRLGGMSGTLRESAGELRSLYGCRIARVPLVRPSQAQWWGRRGFVDEASRRWACVQRVMALQAQGRPVLVGTDSVQASEALSAALTREGIVHQVLNAVQDADEAARVARAGQAGRVTVATNIAGRGTDIRLDDAARAAGGLHVILALSNRSRRIDRQLAGRSARHGDPGSAEALLCLDDPVLAQGLTPMLRQALARLADDRGELPRAVVAPLARWAQQRTEWQLRLLRRDLRLADERLDEQYAFAGGTE